MVRMQNPRRSWDEVREELNKSIEVYYVKDAKTNKEREEKKERTIDWVIEEMKKGIDTKHTLKKLPECSYVFGGEWAYIQKAMRMRYPCCAICGMPTQEIHHVRPRFLKGENIPTNLIPLCLICHDEVHRKLDKLIDQAIVDSIGKDVIDRFNVENTGQTKLI